jgi:hypothetical protein
MRDIVQQRVSQFLAGEFTTDESYYQRQHQEVSQLVKALEQLTKRKIAWEPPIEVFGFYHLQLPVDVNLDVQLYGKTIDELEQLVDEQRSTGFLHLLISFVGKCVCTYWQRFFAPELQETISTEATCQDAVEEELFEQVQQKLEEHGWLWLPPAEAAEPVPEAPPPWPNKEGQSLVRHILFPGCGPLID